MRFAFRDHQGKGLPYAEALTAAGHELVGAGDDADLLLTDLDIAHPGYTSWLARYDDVPIVVYPHGANPILVYDGLYEPHPNTILYLVPAQGHADIMRSYGFDREIAVTGFSFCDLAPFRACSDPKRVLFAPLHPLGDGTMTDQAREQNAEAFRRVLDLGAQVTVRLYGTPEMNGLWADPSVRWVLSDMTVGHDDIEQADLVVAGYGTYGFLAVARGCPTVMYGPHRWAQDGPPGRELAHWNAYERRLRYPLGLDMVELACAGGVAANTWRDWFVGQPYDSERVVRAIELHHDPRRSDG